MKELTAFWKNADNLFNKPEKRVTSLNEVHRREPRITNIILKSNRKDKEINFTTFEAITGE